MSEGQVVVVGCVENVGAVKERGPVFILCVETRRIVAGGVLHGSDLVEGLREGVVRVELQPVPAAVVQGDEQGVVVGDVAVRPDEQVKHAKVVKCRQAGEQAYDIHVEK